MPKLSVRTTIALAIALGLATIFVILTIWQYQLTRRTISAEWEAKETETGRIAAFALLPVLESRDQRMLARAVAQAALVSGIRSLTVVDARGVIVADSKEQGIGNHLALPLDVLRETLERAKEDMSWIEQKETGRIRYLLIPIRGRTGPPSTQVAGALLIGTDLSTMDRVIQSHLRRLATLNGIAFTVLVSLSWFIIHIGLRPSALFGRCAADTRGDAQVQAERATSDLRTLYDTIPIGLLYVRANLVVERISRSFCEWNGRPVEESLGQRLPSVLPPERWTKLQPIIERVLQTGTPYHGLKEQVPDPQAPGEVRYLLSHLYPDVSENGTVRGILLTTQDITSHERAQKEHERHLDELTAKNRELDQMAIRDPLTGLYNRRFFDEALTREWQQFQRSGDAFTIIIMDVDAFKAINDEFGHEVGDRALQQAGNALRATLRESDLIARVGGDEFGALLPRTDADRSEQVSEKLREVLHKLRLTTATGDIRVSVSLGSATVPGFPPVTSAAELLRVADKRMYEAKRLASSRRPDAG